MKPIFRTYPIERIDEDERVVEGYAFVNETVPGEGGIRLKRSAMEAATPNYLTNGTSRELHQPSAAGKPLSVTWDDKGALLRVKVVDDRAWAKVKEGVYKGFSVGVIPEIMQGKDVVKCNWWDTSLVDVGKDKDARFTVWRVEEFSNVDCRFSIGELDSRESQVLSSEDAEPLPPLPPSPLSSAGAHQDGEDETPFHPARSGGGRVGDGGSETFDNPEASDESACSGDNHSLEPLPLCPPPLRSAQDEGAFFGPGPSVFGPRAEESLESQVLSVEEIDRLHDEIFRMQGLQHDAIARAEAAEARVRELERMPRSQRPVVVAELVGRLFGSSSHEELRSELEEISRLAPTSDKQEAERRILEIQRIKRELA